MSNTSLQLMILSSTHHGESKSCSDDICPKLIKNENECFIDLLNNGQILCDTCGKCLRYARKCAVRRGESLESAQQTR